MQCLHCGKKLSLLRKLSDSKFCCDAHREAYYHQQDGLALARLIETRTGRAQAKEKGQGGRSRGRDDGVPAFAPLLPQTATWARWSRMACPPLRPEEAQPAYYLPEPALRPEARGFPVPPATPWPPAVRSQDVEPQTRTQYETPVGPPFLLCAASVRAVSAEDCESVVPPVQPLRSAGIEPARCAGLSNPRRISLRPLERRKMVVIVPKSGLQAGSGSRRRVLHPGLAVGAVPVAVTRVPGVFGLAGPPDHSLAAPTLSAVLDPPAWLGSQYMDTDTETQAAPWVETLPLCKDLRGLPAVLPLAPAQRPAAGAAGSPAPLLAGAKAAIPALRAARCAGWLRIQAALPAAAPRVAVEAPPVVQRIPRAWLWQEPVPAPPRFSPQVRTRQQDWPRPAELLAYELIPASSDAPPLAWPPIPIHLEPEPVVALLGARLPAQRQLRACWRMVPLATAVPKMAAPSAAAVLALCPWGASPEPPPLHLELRPPEPSDALRREESEEQAAAGLRALEEAVVRQEQCAGELPATALDAPLARDAVESMPRAFPAAQAGTAPACETGPDSEPATVPPPCRRLPMMPVRPADCARTLAAPEGAVVGPSWPSLEDPRPALPALRLQLDHADGSGPRREATRQSGRRKKTHAPRKRFWAHAPSDLKWIAVALPLLLVVVVYSFRSNTPNNPSGDSAVTSAIPAPAAAAGTAPAIKANVLQRFIMRRAGVRLFDDFRAGLASWQGRDGWARTWRYGDATFVEPGDLALLSPSIGLTDYTLTFLGQIERRSLNWVFRAQDTSNYYSMRIVITRGGPLPEASVFRSVVIGGKEREAKSLPIPFPVKADTLYLVRMEVRGQDFTTYIQDQLVDHFSDPRLKSGGVGFYSPRGDRALLRWVEVSHQYDYLGRLCALLSPYSVQHLAAD